MPDPKLIVSAYNRALQEARAAGFAIGVQGQKRIDRALSTVGSNLATAFAAGGPGSKRASALTRQAHGIMDRLDRVLSANTAAAQSVTVSTIVDIHRAVAVDLAKRFGTDAGLMAARFDDVASRALGVLAARGGNAATFRSLMKYHLGEGLDDVDRLIDAGVAQGMSAANMGKELEGLLTRRLAQSTLGIATPGLNTVRSDAMRIARTEINNALREANRQNLLAGGIVRAAKWQLSGAHAGLPSSPDRCDEMANAPGVDGQPGYYTIEDWPLAPHPYCGCVQGGPVLYRPSSQWNIRRKPAAPTPGAGAVPIAPPKPARVRKTATPKVPKAPPAPKPPKRVPKPTRAGYSRYVKGGGTDTYWDWADAQKRLQRQYDLDIAAFKAANPAAGITAARRAELLDRTTFTPAKTLDEARFQLRELEGGDLVEPETETMWQTAAKMGSVIPKGRRLEHLNAINRELHALRQRFPTTPKAVGKVYMRDPFSENANGLAYTPARAGGAPQAVLDEYFGMSIRVDRSQDAINGKIIAQARASGKITSPRFSRSSEDWQDPRATTIRHEFTHRLTQKRHLQAWQDAWTDFAMPRRYQWPNDSLEEFRKKWVTDNVSQYASSEDVEEIAEMGAMFTDSRYKDGTLPVQFERVLYDMLGATQEMIDARFPRPKP